MTTFFRLLLCAFLAVVLPAVSYAAACTATSFLTQPQQEVIGRGITPVAACDAALAIYKSNASFGSAFSYKFIAGTGANGSGAKCDFTYTSAGGTAGQRVLSDVGGDYTCTQPAAPTPSEICAAKTGKVLTVNFTEGFTRTPNENDRAAMVRDTVGPVSRPPANGEFCSAGCKVVAETSGSNVQPYVSQTATAAGLYRRSIDMPAQHLGIACTAGTGLSTDVQINPNEPSPPCPGFVGTIDGKTVCVGTASKPVLTTDIGRTTNPPALGNPAAGDKPASGEGSGSGGTGRTPSVGSGGNAGGPTASAGGTPTGSVTAPAAGTEQANCGAPGQPKCRIDESGTPDGKDALRDGLTKLDENEIKAKEGIDGARNIASPAWSFTFQFPVGCQPYATGIKGVVLDLCRWQSIIHDLMSMVWAAVTAFAIIGMVGRTVREA